MDLKRHVLPCSIQSNGRLPPLQIIDHTKFQQLCATFLASVGLHCPHITQNKRFCTLSHLFITLQGFQSLLHYISTQPEKHPSKLHVHFL